MSEPIKESGPQQIAYARRGSLKLLARLQAEHDCNISPPKNWKRRAAPKPVTREPWFSVLACVEEIDIPHEPKIGDIRRAACRHFGISSVNLNAERRTPDFVHARYIAMYLARELTARSLPEIGRHFGGRDHTTVLHGCRKIAAKVKTDWTVAFDVAHVEARLNEISH